MKKKNELTQIRLEAMTMTTCLSAPFRHSARRRNRRSACVLSVVLDNNVFLTRRRHDEKQNGSLPPRRMLSTSCISTTTLARAQPIAIVSSHATPTSPISPLFRPTIQSTRSVFTIAEVLPEFAQNWTVWGASGWLLKTLHGDGIIPYWACFSITSILVRTCLLPLVLKSAHTAATLAKVAPEVQFLVTLFQNDLRKQRAEGASLTEQRVLAQRTFQTLRGLYKLHKTSPLDTFKAPLMQIPVFWYFSIDLRKIINDADPELAQQLTESGVLWIADLTEPDPYYGLPILGGALLYYNVEVAVGRRSLTGETASKSNIAMYMKDFFQSLAVFMPCFMSQSPAGMQIYLCTAFLFTLFQGKALRNETFRAKVGLPSLSFKPEAELAKEFMELKRLEQASQEAWNVENGGEVLGSGTVLAAGFEISFPGQIRPSTIQGSVESSLALVSALPHLSKAPHAQVTHVDPTPKVYAPPETFLKEQVEESSTKTTKQRTESKKKDTTSTTRVMERSPDELMEAANRGELLEPIVVTTSTDENKTTSSNFDAKKFVQNKKGGRRRSNKGRGGKRRK